MRELQLDGIHDDGDHLVMTDSDGERYTLRIDEALRAAVRRDRPALGMIQAAQHAPLRPREIQAMLRAGRDAEEIARIADVDVEHVRRFEGPVLAEREYIAERARAFHVGRGGGPTLGDLTAQRLRARQADPEARWDAWRNDDGTWTIELAFEAGGRAREAHWNVDMPRQAVTADDDEARWLTDDEVPVAGDGRGRPRLTAVKGRVYDVEADGGVDHEELSSTPWGSVRRTPRDEHPAAIAEDDLDALNARRGLRSLSSRTAPSDAPDSVWSRLDEAADPDAEAVREHADEAPEGEDVEVEDVESHDAADAPEDGADALEDAEDQAPSTPESHHGDTVELTPLPGFDGEGTSTTPARKKPRTKRSSIPSWDEIVFGSKSED